MATSLEVVLAKQVRHWRTKLEWSGELLAKRMSDLGLPWDQNIVSRVERNKRSVSAVELVALGIALNIPPPVLLFGIGNVDEVELSPSGPSVHPYGALRWSIGETPLPGRIRGVGHSSWKVGADAIGTYEHLGKLEEKADKARFAWVNLRSRLGYERDDPTPGPIGSDERKLYAKYRETLGPIVEHRAGMREHGYRPPPLREPPAGFPDQVDPREETWLSDLYRDTPEESWGDL